jgi:hypothetical protein
LIRFYNFLIVLIGGFLPALFGVDHSGPQAKVFPFQIGERLEFDMKWGFFPVGSASMELLASEPSRPDGAKLVRFQVRTNSFADNFYKVRTSVSSTIDPFFSRTLRYEKIQHEGSTQREIVVEYDYPNKVARYRQKGQSEMVTEIPGPVFDPLSIAYFFRLHPLVQNGERRLPTCDGKKFREVIVKAGRREKIKLPGGEIYAVPTTPKMENLGGVFNKSPKGMLEVWYSDDQRRVPVRISSKVVVGSFTATLVKASPPLF